MRNRKHILIIANKRVFPTIDGGSVAIKSLCEIFLNKNYNIDLMCIEKDDSSKTQILTNDGPKELAQWVFPVNMNFNLKNLLESIITRTSYQVSRFYNQSIKEKIQLKINEVNKKTPYQIIIFESVFTLPYLNKLKFPKSSKIILRAHNIEHKIWRDLANTHLIKKIVYLFLAKQIKNIEESIPQYVDYIFTLSNLDTNWYLSKYPNKTHNIPVTFSPDYTNTEKIKNSLVHLGAMDWRPNVEGINWFLKYVLPKFELLTDIKLFIAGKAMPPQYFNYQNKNVTIEDEIKNAKEYIKTKEVMFVPLFSGSGIRIKILEGMALGIPIVSTSKGAQGIPCTHQKNILLANTADEFYEAILLLITDKEFAKKIGNNGRELIKTHFSHHAVQTKIDKLLN